MDYQNSVAYFRDTFIPAREANLNIASAPVLYGLSVYTVLGANYNTKTKTLYAFRLKEHYERLVESARIVDFGGWEQKWTYEAFETLVLELLRKNKVRQDVLVRITLFIDELMSGTRMHGLKVCLSAFVYPAGGLHRPEGIHVCISSWQRTPDNAIPSRAKVNGSYINSSLMKNEALLNGYDDAIALDEHGHVSESTVANLFLVRKGTLVTPHSATDILEGITRNSILTIAEQMGIPHEQRSVDRSELYLAEEVFLSGSSAFVTPVLSVDKRPVGNGKPGTLTEKLAKAYADAQHGRRAKTKQWLTEVK